MKRFKLTDEDGSEYDVKEIDEDTVSETEKSEEKQLHDDDTLSADEIVALKKLAGVADKLVALIPVEEAEHANDEDVDEDEIVDENKACDEDEPTKKEEVVETKSHDSIQKSVGKPGKKITDSSNDLDAHELEIENAWTNMYKEVK